MKAREFLKTLVHYGRVDKDSLMLSLVMKELDELERLAEIGREKEKKVDVIDNCICDNCSSTVLKGWVYCAYCKSTLLWEED